MTDAIDVPNGLPALARRIGLPLVVAALGWTLLLGFVQKTGTWCAGGLRGSGAAPLCYTDIVPLYRNEGFRNDRLPYLEPCVPVAGDPCDEYPPLTMYTMWLGALVATRPSAFFFANALVLSIAAATTAIALYGIAGSRALYFALAPTLLLYAFYNWDLVAAALATLATFAFLRRRDGLAGVLIGLGAAAKLYPALLLIPFVLQRVRDGEADRGVRLGTAAAVGWLATNLPFAIAAPGGWASFFRFNASRPLNVDSLWYVACRTVRPGSGGQCLAPSTVNVLAIVLTCSMAAGLWYVKSRRDAGWAAWTFAFPLLIVFLLTNKVYSPQYSLWLLPWFALVHPRLGKASPRALFLLFGMSDVTVFVTELLWFSGGSHVSDALTLAFALAVVGRDLVLILWIWAWVRSPTPAMSVSWTHPSVRPRHAARHAPRPHRPTEGSRRSGQR
jgi:hypothetical protein